VKFKTVVIKYAEQIVKQQESTVSAKETSEGGKNRNKNLRMSIPHENCSVAQNMVAFMKLRNKLFSLYAKTEWNTCFM
jgi:hypothetical protein